MPNDYPDINELGTEAGAPELRLWRYVLLLMVRDGRGYWLQKKASATDHKDCKEAFDDLLQCGPMLQHVCEHTGNDARRLSKSFIAWCENEAG